MSWTDILYPGNSDMKIRLASLSGQLYTLVENCFVSVNHLIDSIHQYLPGLKFEKICMNDSKSLADNCNIIIGRVNEINAYVTQKGKDVELLIGTELFKQLSSPDTTFQQKIDIAKKAVTIITTSGWLVGGVILAAMIITGKILTNVVAKIGKLATCFLAFIVLGIFCSAVNMIISAVIGAVEKKKLKKALEEYEDAVKTFKTAANEFCENIMQIRVKLEHTMKG
ncbi:hypothetical protein ACJMK2_001529 [Sinanodonta woodiana]|uniref:Uncharacterized protein n=1 Tax=Sinanodonta woodiana TaxID=1069815 RepID=A0ABD3XVZ8_SINWO